MIRKRCQVCRHLNREAIEKQFINGVPVRDIARRYLIDRNAIGRHCHSHVPETLALARDQLELRHARDLAATLNRLYQKGQELLARAEAEGDTRAALVALRELVNVVEVAARAAGVAEAPPFPERGPILIKVVYDVLPRRCESLDSSAPVSTLKREDR